MLPAIVFLLITLLAIVLFWLATGRDRRVLAFFPVWALLIGGLSYSGFFQETNTFPPRILLVILPAIIYVIWFYRKLRRQSLKTHYLLAIHVLRIPVELVLYRLFLAGKIPVIMTFEGWNFDIFSGISALLILLYTLLRKRPPGSLFLRCWNIMGIVLLAIIVVTAMLSAPSPVQQLAFDQPNVAILQFPYTLLPAVVVPIVLLAHLLGLRQSRS